MKTAASTTIGVNIQNPHTFYTGTNPNSTPYYNSWSAKNTTVQTANPTTDNTVVKTIYDPCPVGYTVAPANAFSKFTTTNWDNTNKGGTFGGCWFPGTGQREARSSVPYVVGSYGAYVQAVPGSNGARRLGFDSSFSSPTGSVAGSYGNSVRPVAEIEN